jgi:cytochrome P450
VNCLYSSISLIRLLAAQASFSDPKQCLWVSLVQDKVEITGGTKHFMAFGGGLRFCVGTDLSKVLMATFIPAWLQSTGASSYSQVHKYSEKKNRILR